VVRILPKRYADVDRFKTFVASIKITPITEIVECHDIAQTQSAQRKLEVRSPLGAPACFFKVILTHEVKARNSLNLSGLKYFRLRLDLKSVGILYSHLAQDVVLFDK
jgi:hypothetical protein